MNEMVGMTISFTGSVDKISTEEIGERCNVAQRETRAHAQATEESGQLMAQFHAHQSEEEEHEKGNAQYEDRHYFHIR